MIRQLTYGEFSRYTSGQAMWQLKTKLYTDEIKRLSVIADALPYYTAPEIQKYGLNTKRINYKEMAIIFAIYGPIVYIHCIIPANAIARL